MATWTVQNAIFAPSRENVNLPPCLLQRSLPVSTVVTVAPPPSPSPISVTLWCQPSFPTSTLTRMFTMLSIHM